MSLGGSGVSIGGVRILRVNSHNDFQGKNSPTQKIIEAKNGSWLPLRPVGPLLVINGVAIPINGLING